MSVASLFGYRSGSIKISPKALGKLEKAERDAGILPPLKARFMAETDWIKRGEMIQEADSSEVFMLLASSERDTWDNCPPAMRDSLLARFSYAVEGLLRTLDAEEWGKATAETKLQREQFYAEVGKLKPLFDSWRSALCKQSEAAAFTAELVAKRDALAKRIAEDEKELGEIAERLSAPEVQDTVMAVASREERFKMLTGIAEIAAAAKVKSGRPEESAKADVVPSSPRNRKTAIRASE